MLHRLALARVFLRLAELPRLVPIEEILASGATLAVAATPAAAATGTAPVRPAAPAEPARRPGPAEPRAAAVPETPRFVGLTPLAVAEAEPEPPSDAATAFREAVEKRHANLGAALEDVSVTVEGRAVRLVLDPPSPPLARRLAEPAVRKVLDEAAAAVLGPKASVYVESAEPEGGDLTAAAEAADPARLERENLRKRAGSDERLRKILDIFDGEIADVKPDERKA